jgi:hypothetical protein
MPNVEKVQLNQLDGLRQYLAFMAVAAFLAVTIVAIMMLVGGLPGVLSVS